MSAILQKDAYKIGHINQYPVGTTEIYSNFTARSGKHSNTPDSKGIYFVGLQYFILDYLVNEWNETFFFNTKETVVAKYQRRVSNILGYTVDVSHVEALHDLGYLPIVVKALPEGSFIPYNVPMLTIKNTLPEFYWVTNMLESVMSAELWQPITTATTYMAYKKLFAEYAERTGSPLEFVPYQGHDFSFRGMAGRHAAAISGFAVLACGGIGTDCIPAIDIAEDYYLANSDNEIVGQSVPASEHSVMCSGTQEGEFDTYKRLLTETYPSGIVAIVSDTWDFFKVVTEYLPKLKELIMSRDGKLTIRPDSGNPVDIICGNSYQAITADSLNEAKADALDYLVNSVSAATSHGRCGESDPSAIFSWNGKYYEAKAEIEWNRHDKMYYYMDGEELLSFEEVVLLPEQKGLIELLWDTFGGTINDKGFKVLDSHIGAIYGDSITYDRAKQILSRLEAKGFASCNIVFGIGSFSLQVVSRDTHGMAMKSTNAVINGVHTPIFKDPKTDDGTKKSAKGLLMVSRVGDEYQLNDMVDTKQEKHGCLETVFKDGKLIKQYSLTEIRALTGL